MSKPPESGPGRKWNLIIDVAKSVHGANAILSAKDEYVGNEHPGYSAPVPEEGGDLFTLERKVRGEAPVVDAAYLLKTCNHCDDAPCKKVGGDAVIKRDDGITIIDPVKAKGRRDIYEACPYNALIWNEELELPQNWIFDAHLLDAGWPVPRCVDATPLDSIEAIKVTDADMQRKAEAEGLSVLHPELGTKPRVYYRNMYRFTSCFIGGTLVSQDAGAADCVEGATIEVFQGDELLGMARSDAFGEFKIDRLAPNSGSYRVVMNMPGVGRAEQTIDLSEESVYLGVVALI
ncbi:MAG: 4Fe-4S dicluster domain-containing protein [Pseudomonadota bacterium]